MAKLTVDGQVYEVAEGRTILQVLDDLGVLMNGVDVPHYCWHPKLSIDGSCRLCQVEIEGMPKLQIACNTPVRDGMVVRTQGEKVAAARQGVMELLLVNHPLDCPICDQAGECKLQDYAFDYGVKHERTDFPRRTENEGVELAPPITVGQERCILCRRCVRFCREIPGTGELGVFDRGDESLLEVFPGAKLDNPYSMNVADICPVGALTTEDFRFKIRVWFLDDVESVCNQCANGCNVNASRSNNRVYRYVPRRNAAVNDTWMCDHGRLSYKELTRDRLDQPRADGAASAYDVAVKAAGALLRGALDARGRVIGVASPFASNEDLWMLRKLLAELGAPPASFVVPRGEADEILIREEKAPNANGARALGFVESSAALGPAALALVLGHTTPPAALAGVEKLVLIDTHRSELSERAHVALPARTHAEYEGSFTNWKNRAQRFAPVLEPSFEAWPMGGVLAQIAAAAGLSGWDAPYEPRAVSRELAAGVPAFAEASLERLGALGVELAK